MEQAKTNDVEFRKSESSYKPSIQGRTTVVSRSSTGGYGGSLGRFESVTRRTTSSTMSSVPTSGYADISASGVNNFKEERFHEKAEMQDLNSRLANYVEKMRYSESLCKALEKEIEKLRKGKDVDFEKIKNMYEDELKAARKVIEELSKAKADVDVKVLSLEDENSYLKNELAQAEKERELQRQKADKLGDQIGDYESEVIQLRNKVGGLDEHNAALNDTIKRLQQEHQRLRQDLDQETVEHINEANRAQGLEEELSFITQVYEREIKELQEIAKRDTTIEMRDFWKGEMGSALHDIQAEYDARLNQISSTLESKYNAQLSAINGSIQKDNRELESVTDENKRYKLKISDINSKLSALQGQIAPLEERIRQQELLLREKDDDFDNMKNRLESENFQLRNDFEVLLKEMKALTDAKLSLEMEIAAYRKLLESEEDRYDSMRSKFDGLGGVASANETAMQQLVLQRGSYEVNKKPDYKGEFTGRLVINRTSRGGLTFDEITPDGKCLTITNKGSTYRRRDIVLKGWTIERHFADERTNIVYHFPEGMILKAEQSIRIYGRDAKRILGENELQANFDNWGTDQADTYLKDDTGSEKASHKQAYAA